MTTPIARLRALVELAKVLGAGNMVSNEARRNFYFAARNAIPDLEAVCEENADLNHRIIRQSDDIKILEADWHEAESALVTLRGENEGLVAAEREACARTVEYSSSVRERNRSGNKWADPTSEAKAVASRLALTNDSSARAGVRFWADEDID